MTQVLINSLAGACLSLLIAISFWLVYATTRIFYITHAAAIALGAYGCFWLTHQMGLPFFVALPASVATAAAILQAAEKALFRKLRNDGPGWVGLVASIGLYVVLQNLISLGFGDETQVLRTAAVVEGRKIGDAYVTDTQVLIVLISAVLFASTALLLATTRLGRAIRGVASNPDLCVLFGVDRNRVVSWTIAMGSGLAAIGGILAGLDSDLTPTMGFRLLMNGVVVMIVGGAGGIAGFPLAAILLALAQHTAAYVFDAKWMDAVAYLVLIAFLIWKPLGFSGRRVKKVEI